MEFNVFWVSHSKLNVTIRANHLFLRVLVSVEHDLVCQQDPNLVLRHESLPVFDSTTGEHLEEARILGNSGFEDLHAHPDYEESYEKDRYEQYQEEDAPHCTVTLYERIFLSSLIIKAEVYYEDHNEQRHRLKRVELIIIERLLLDMKNQGDDKD